MAFESYSSRSSEIVWAFGGSFESFFSVLWPISRPSADAAKAAFSQLPHCDAGALDKARRDVPDPGNRSIRRGQTEFFLINQRGRLVVAGGGLAAALIAQRLNHGARVPVTILEGAAQPFGEHTWSFHTSDVGPSDMAWLSPLIAHQWQGQSVRFRDHSRSLTSGYATLTSASVAAALAKLDSVEIRPGPLP
jgi:hypothetical protein